MGNILSYYITQTEKTQPIAALLRRFARGSAKKETKTFVFVSPALYKSSASCTGFSYALSPHTPV